MTEQKMKIKELFENDTDGGIFHRIQKIGFFSWLTEDMAGDLDTEYIYLRSGDKSISPLLEHTPLDKVSSIIVTKFGDKWNRLYDAFITQTYNPLDNYSMTETEKTNSKVKVTSSGTAGTYGFNSDNSVPTGESSTETTSEGNADDNNRELTRSGNIGVTTSQQMLQSELDLRKWNFANMLYDDVDSICCLCIYD
jgi:hypothetical protein